MLIEGLIDEGDLDAACALTAQTEPRMAPPEVRLLNVWFHLARGRLRAIRGDHDRALADFFEAGEIMAAYEQRSPYLAWRLRAAHVLITTGEDARAAELIEAELALADDYGLPSVTGAALRTRARLEEPGAARASLTRAVELLEASGNPLERLRALRDLGELELRRDDPGAAQTPLRQALDLAHSCGASALEAEVRALLVRSGARPRRAAASGAESLTSTERRVAELAAQGLTNPQIAEQLVVSPSTVEWHLTNTYRKLDATRATLREMLSG